MEAAKIDWSKIESVFMVDHVYEDINAPQWVDLLSPPPLHDDVAWFCRPDCKHPSSAEDFLNSPPLPSASSKLIGLVDWTRREPNMKRRGGAAHSFENQDPNFLTPNRQIKSSALKREQSSSRRLNSTLSAKDLFGGGKDLVDRFTDLCNDLKKMVTRPPPLHHSDPQQQEPPTVTNGVQKKHRTPSQRLPFLELPVDTSSANHKAKKNNIKRPAADTENIPVNIVTPRQEGKLVGVRTNPPTPQGFSATRDPCKAPKSRLIDRGILEEVGQSKTATEEGSSGSREGRTLDVFWFLKPCTLSS